MAPQYQIRFSRSRQRLGLKPWAVFEVVDEGFNKGLSDHQTWREADSAMAALLAQAAAEPADPDCGPAACAPQSRP